MKSLCYKGDYYKGGNIPRRLHMAKSGYEQGQSQLMINYDRSPRIDRSFSPSGKTPSKLPCPFILFYGSKTSVLLTKNKRNTYQKKKRRITERTCVLKFDYTAGCRYSLLCKLKNNNLGARSRKSMPEWYNHILKEKRKMIRSLWRKKRKRNKVTRKQKVKLYNLHLSCYV